MYRVIFELTGKEKIHLDLALAERIHTLQRAISKGKEQRRSTKDEEEQLGTLLAMRAILPLFEKRKDTDKIY